jgi:hypothetical protein
MKSVLVAVLIYPCHSLITSEPHISTTFATVCPNTAKYQWADLYETPMEYALAQAAIAKSKQAAEPAPPENIVKAATKPAKKKTKRKKKRRRG